MYRGSNRVYYGGLENSKFAVRWQIISHVENYGSKFNQRYASIFRFFQVQVTVHSPPDYKFEHFTKLCQHYQEQKKILQVL